MKGIPFPVASKVRNHIDFEYVCNIMRLSEKARAMFDRNIGKPTLLSERWDKDTFNSHRKCTNSWPTLIQAFMELVVKLELLSHS